MNELILHIGTMKTGTTALQCFFYDNRNSLLRNGISYHPDLEHTKIEELREEEDTEPTAFMNGRLVVDAARRLYDPKTWETEIARLKGKLAELREHVASHRATILTNENIWHLGAIEADFYSNLKRMADEYLPGIPLRIVLYLRPQEEMALSMWRQFVFYDPEPRDFRTYLTEENTPKFLDYADTVFRLEEAFGRDCVTVRRYVPGRFIGGDIFHDFCDAAGIGWDDEYDPPRKLLNPSLTVEMSEALRLVIKHNKNITILRSTIRGIGKAFSKIYTEPRGMHVLNYEERLALRAEYEEGNRRIAQEYFGGEPLFDPVREDTPVWEYDEKRLRLHAGEILAISRIIDEERRRNEAEKRAAKAAQQPDGAPLEAEPSASGN